MSKKYIVLASSNVDEVGEIQALLEADYHVISITQKADYDPSQISCDLIIVDTNFAGDQSVEFIRMAAAGNPIPILVIMPIEDQLCAIETMQAGAFNYLIKISNYFELLPFVIEQAVQRFAEIEEFKEKISVMTERIADLEQRITFGGSSVESPKAGGQDARKSLLDEIAKKLRKGEINFPIYPDINTKLTRLINEQASIEKISDLLKADPPLVASLIRVANSVAYKVGKDVQTLDQAIQNLGLKQTRNVVEIIANRALFKSINNPKLLQSIWRHSLACANVALITAKQLRHPSAHELFTMGLLHDMGYLLLLQIISELEASNPFGVKMENEALMNFLHAHHGSFGRALLNRWKLPEEFGYVAMYHEDLDSPEAPSTELLLINFAHLLIRTIGYGLNESKEKEIELENTLSAKTLGLDTDAILLIKEKAIVQVNGVDAVLL